MPLGSACVERSAAPPQSRRSRWFCSRRRNESNEIAAGNRGNREHGKPWRRRQRPGIRIEPAPAFPTPGSRVRSNALGCEKGCHGLKTVVFHRRVARFTNVGRQTRPEGRGAPFQIRTLPPRGRRPSPCPFKLFRYNALLRAGSALVKPSYRVGRWLRVGNRPVGLVLSVGMVPVDAAGPGSLPAFIVVSTKRPGAGRAVVSIDGH